MSVYLLSYKGTHKGLAGVVNVGIRALDRSIYSHSELCLTQPFEGEVRCYSSAGVDGGVRHKDMVLNRDKWDAQAIPGADAKDVLRFYDETRGSGYDFWGTGRFALPFMLREHKELYFCSEWCLAALRVKDAWRFSPGGAAALVASLGATPV